MKVLADRVLVKVIQPQIKTSIAILESTKAAMIPTQGYVEQIGEGFIGVDMQVKVGDRVLFGRSSGYTEPSIFGEGYLMMKQSDILAVLDDDANVILK